MNTTGREHNGNDHADGPVSNCPGCIIEALEVALRQIDHNPGGARRIVHAAQAIVETLSDPGVIVCNGNCIGTSSLETLFEDLCCPLHGVEAQEAAQATFPDRQAWFDSLATRPTGDKSGPEDGQSDTVPMKRPVMEEVDPAATDSGHVGASTYVWLIERGQAEHQEPTVWATKTGPMTWSQDPWAAIRFQTEAAAESFIAEHLTHPTRGPSARAVQHGFSRPTGDKE